MTVKIENLAGFIYRDSDELSVKELFSRRHDIDTWESLIEGEWHTFVWHALSGDIRLVLREGKDRFMLLSQDQAHVIAFLDICGIENRLEKPRIAVTNFVTDLVAPVNDEREKSPGRQYRVSAVFAAIDGYGRSLKTMALWGSDLLNAELFTLLLKQVSPYRVTVRDLLQDSDIVSIDSNGEVNFFFRGPTQLRKVDTFFRYLKKRGYIRWALHGEEHKSGES